MSLHGRSDMPAPAAAPTPTLDALRHALDTVVERERPRDDPALPTGLDALDEIGRAHV